jgi:hypothetical protein
MNRRGLFVAALGALGLAALPALASAEEHKKGGGDSYIELDTLSATITRANGRRGVISVEVGVDVPDAGLHTRAAESTPLLRAAYGDVLRTYAAGLPPGSLPNADYLEREFQRQTDMTLGKPGAKLLLGTIMVN